MLRQWIPTNIVAEILSKSPLALDGDDCAIWCLTESGDFSIAHSYLVTRAPTSAFFMFEKIWSGLIPSKLFISNHGW